MDDSVISPGKPLSNALRIDAFILNSHKLILFLGNKMADSASESDSSSLDGGAMLPPSTISRDQLQKRIESLQQQNR